MKSNRTAAPADWMSPKEVAKLYDLHPATIYRYCQNGTLKAHRVGTRYRIKREDALALLAPVETAPPVSAAEKRRREIADVIRELEAQGYTVR